MPTPLRDLLGNKPSVRRRLVAITSMTPSDRIAAVDKYLSENGHWFIVAALDLVAVLGSSFFFLTLAANLVWPAHRMHPIVGAGVSAGLLAAVSSLMALALALRLRFNERRKRLTAQAFLIGWAPAVLLFVITVAR